jgi:hypothetical protein
VPCQTAAPQRSKLVGAASPAMLLSLAEAQQVLVAALSVMGETIK